MHLREKHPNDVYSCDVCQYATSMNKGNITMHMLTHGNPKVYTCSDCDYTALHQRIMEEHILGQHVSTDKQSDKADCMNVEMKPVQIKEAANQAGSPAIWLKCSDCGFSTTEKDELHDHVIAKHLLIQETNAPRSADNRPPRTASSKPREMFGSVAVKKTPMPMSAHAAALKELNRLEKDQHHNKGDVTRIRQIVENEPPYVCWLCSFESSVAFEFITHMIKQHIAGGDRAGSKTVADLMGKQHTPQPLHLRSQPLKPDCAQSADKKSTAASDQAYQYDAYNKWYQCTLCGYSTEHQRSIKAHIWKHTGHKDLDYPMFQNGPLSMYDTTAVIKSREEVISASRSITRQSSGSKRVAASTKKDPQPPPLIKRQPNSTAITTVKAAQPTAEGNQQEIGGSSVFNEDCAAVESISDVTTAASDGNQTRDDDYIVLRIPQSRIDPDRDLSEQIQEIVNGMDVIPNEVVIGDVEEEEEPKVEAAGAGEEARGEAPENKTSQTTATIAIKNEPKEEDKAASSAGAAVSPRLLPKIVAINCTKSKTTLIPTAQTLIDKDNVIVPTATEMIDSDKKPIVATSESTPAATKSAEFSKPELSLPTSVPHIAAEAVVTQASDVTTVEQPAIHSSHDVPQQGDDVVIDVETPDSPQPFIPEPMRVRSAHGTPVKTPDMAVEVSVCSSAAAAPISGRSSSSGGASHDSSTDDDSQMSGGYNDSDAEIVTLLTLLKKGPNFNPAYPTALKATAASELAKQRLEGLADAVRKRVGETAVAADAKTQEFGISSSLLAVIEQLRERTNSTSDDVIVDDSQIGELLETCNCDFYQARALQQYFR